MNLRERLPLPCSEIARAIFLACACLAWLPTYEKQTKMKIVPGKEHASESTSIGVKSWFEYFQQARVSSSKQCEPVSVSSCTSGTQGPSPGTFANTQGN